MIPYKSQKDLDRIIKKYVSGKATADEVKFVEAYYEYLNDSEDVLANEAGTEVQKIADENFQAIQQKIRTVNNKPKAISLYKYVAAAILLVTVGVGLWYTSSSRAPVAKHAVAKKLDVMPGADKAVLTLADGSKIVLDHQNEGNIVELPGVTITKTSAGQLIYKVKPSLVNAAVVAFNTIETPKGGQYQVILPDGTKVWLNAASSLKYPEIFSGSERKVELTGEAYFEVAKNKAVPFKVWSKNQQIEVLGTHFNVNTYMDDQAVKTTLLEGSIKIYNAKSARILHPGEQALSKNYGLAALEVLPNIDAEAEVAWKNGQFNFDNANLKSILNQLERWYDIKIDYATIPNKRYNGMVPRKAKLSEVLNMLELTGNISFEILAGRELKVYTKQKN